LHRLWIEALVDARAQLPGHDDGIAVDDLGGPVRQSVRRLNVRTATSLVARHIRAFRNRTLLPDAGCAILLGKAIAVGV
jgi:hypothetical protein